MLNDEYFSVNSCREGMIFMANCNEENCTCPKAQCERHGKCCECINFHREYENKVFCMRDPAESK